MSVIDNEFDSSVVDEQKYEYYSSSTYKNLLKNCHF